MGDGAKVSVNREYLDNLERKVEDLKTLVEVSALISSTLHFNDLMNIVMEKAKDVMDAEACSILLYNRETRKLEFEVALCTPECPSDILKRKVKLDIGQGIAGWTAQNLKPVLVSDAGTDQRFSQKADDQTGFTTKSLIAIPLTGKSGLLGVAEIMNPRTKDSFDEYDLEIFQALCRQVAIAIENSLFYQESIERERLRQEIELAATLQKSFLPESPVFTMGNIKVSAVNVSAKQVGGDLYDFFELVEGKAGVLIGDVSGKGVSAALFMAKMISDFRYTARLVESPEIVLNRLNSLIAEAPRGIFITAIYLIADTVTGNLRVSVAGHPPFLWLTRGDVRIMEVPAGPPLGIIPQEYASTDISLQRGERLILLTDGAFEAKNREGKRIGFRELVRFIREHMAEEELLELVCDHLEHYSKGMEMADDVTLVELRFLDGGL